MTNCEHATNRRHENHKDTGFSQNHVDSCRFDKDDNRIQSCCMQSLDGIATDVQNTMLTLQYTSELHVHLEHRRRPGDKHIHRMMHWYIV